MRRPLRTPQIILTDVRYLDQRTGKCDLLFYCFSIIFGGGVKIPTIRGFIQ